MTAREASVFWIATTAEEIHYIDAILSAYDGVANVRRDYVLWEGKTFFKIYVGPGMEEDFLSIMAALRPHAAIRELVRGTDEAPRAG